MRLVLIWVTRKFFNLIKFLCSFILFDVISFFSVTQILRQFFAWYALYMFLRFFKKNLMKALFEKTTFFFSFVNNLTCNACVHLIFRMIDVFFVLRRRRFRVSNKRCLICWQKFSINTSRLCFFIRCLKNIYKRIIYN